jgi:Fe-S cluster assembly protein SufD
MEDWRHLDLSGVYSQAFSKATVELSLDEAPIGDLPAETAHSRLFFANNRHNLHLSDTSSLGDDVLMSPLTEASPGMTRRLGRLATPERSDLFANINTAHFEDGALVYVPGGQSFETPLHVVFYANGDEDSPPMHFPRLLVALGPGANARLVEEYRGIGKYLTAAVVEVFLGEGARLRHDRVQRESGAAYHFCALHAHLSNSASYASTQIMLGAAISRNNPIVALCGEEAELELNGLSMIGGTQTADTHSFIDHAVPNCASRQLQKYVVGGSGVGVFNGQIMARPGAQQTDASQSSRNLLLAESTKIYTKPQLEIYADDVKCSHGAAIGQMNAEELFYLQSRGLDMQAAKNLLLEGFAADVLNRLTLPWLRHSLLRNALGSG